MNSLTITDLGNTTVQVSWQRGNAAPRFYPQPIPFADPLDDAAHEELRWYLEDYLQFPYGAEDYHAAKVEALMQEWGKSLFNQVFIRAAAAPDPAAFYQEAVRDGLDKCDICIASDDPKFLSVPWELMHDSIAGKGYLAPSAHAFFRRRSTPFIRPPFEIAPGDPLRILVVIARPDGVRDVPLGMITRPVLEALRPLRDRIHVELLRAPTFDNFRRCLHDRSGFFHLIHFDGHGDFADTGYLFFERDDGSGDAVSSSELGQVLNTAKAPLFVLNACRSAQEDVSDPYASVASTLVATGAKGVIAMSHSVYAVTAAKFMGEFYRKAVSGASLGEAVAAARGRLFADAERPSPIGPLKLRDWIVPTLYLDDPGYKPFPDGGASVREDAAALDAAVKAAEERCEPGRFGFVGRNADVLRIERELYDDDRPWVLLTGMGGVGKTALAYGFARWYAETGGCPGGVFATSFRYKADFDQVIGSVVGFGTDFSRLSDEEQWDQLVGYLRANPCLLVWDNFEPVNGYPDRAEPLATDDERSKLSRFLKALRGGKSRVLITTRKPGEDWLDIGYAQVPIRGLDHWDAGDLARSILTALGKSPADFKGTSDYDDLLKLLSGHPKSLEVVLPLLRTRSPRALIEALTHDAGSSGLAMEDTSLMVAFFAMSEPTRKHLPFIGLFSCRVLLPIIDAFLTRHEECRTVYKEVFGEVPASGAWKGILDEAAHAGFIASQGGRVFELHPTVPLFLRGELLSRLGADRLTLLDNSFTRFHATLGSAWFDDVRSADSDALTFTSLEEPNFLRALRIAEHAEWWSDAQSIVQVLYFFYEACGRSSEWHALRRATIKTVGWDSPAASQPEKGSLWMFLLGNEAAATLARNDLEQAEQIYRRTLTYLLSLGDRTAEPKVATVYHQLGTVAEERSQSGEAEKWYRKALEIRERLGLERDAANDYHELGMITQDRGQLDEAEELYRKALEIRERLGLERNAADDYHQLGTLAQERGQLDDAEEWYRRALEISERLGLSQDAAANYHQLGMIALDRSQFDEAETWSKKALEIREHLGRERDASTDYHQLGIVAQLRGQFDEAEEWYKKALEIFQRFGLERDAASGYHQLGMVAQERSQFDKAEKWYRKALETFERCRLDRSAANSCHQLGLIAQTRNRFDEAEKWYRKALETFECFGLERDAADEYHQLGIVAQKRGEFDKAEEWYSKALAAYGNPSHPPILVQTLAASGVLSRDRGDLPSALRRLGSALFIATDYAMSIRAPMLKYLARIMKSMGETQFIAVWTTAFPGQAPPLDDLRAALKELRD